MSLHKDSDQKLDQYEQALENNFDNVKSVKNVSEEKQRLQEAASLHVKKNERITLRISSDDLLGIKKAAKREGMPYQTLITSILHKFVTGDLVNKQAH